MRYCVISACTLARAALGAQPLVDDVNVSRLAVYGFLRAYRQAIAAADAPEGIDHNHPFTPALAGYAALLGHVLLEFVFR